MKTRHDDIARLFQLVCNLEGEEQQAVLNRECGADHAIRSEVLQLLRADASTDSFFPPITGGVPLPRLSLLGNRDGDEQLVDQTIAGFRLDRLIARGGMGSVFQATQSQPCRKVAVKVMHGGWRSTDAAQRFRYESEVLGRLRHPNITQVFESGTVEGLDGSARPYFAMEFVEGARTLTDWAAHEGLNVRGRIELIMAVCDAVAHGHQRGVIHRDLKPDNILVDNEGRVKVIDFGIARVTDSDIAVTAITGVGQLMGTLQYMSPEQCNGDPGQIDTRTDVYSLGVVLYELLTGALPYSVQPNGVAHAIRAIQESSPELPSRLNRDLRGDLETILIRALEKSPASRYQSVAELREDLRRFLNSEPILARSPSAVYRFRRFVQRHRTASVAIAAVTFIMVSATIVSTWFAVDADRESRHRAAAERDARWQSYLANIAAASLSLDSNQISRARWYLEAAPEEYRSWEWHYLMHSLDQSSATFWRGSSQVYSLAFNPEGSAFVCGAGDGSIRTWDVESGATRILRPPGTAITYAVDWSARGLIATGDRNGRVELYDPTSGESAAVLTDVGGRVFALAFDTSGEMLAAGVTTGEIIVWSSEPWRTKTVLRGHTRLVRTLTFSSDGSRIISGSYDGTVRMWDVGTGSEVFSMPAHRGQVMAVDISRDGSQIVSCGLDGIIKLWNANTGAGEGVISTGGTGVYQVAFNPTGDVIVAANADSTVTLWSARVLELLNTYRGHASMVFCLALERRGRSLVTGDRDGDIRLWDLESNELLGRFVGHRDNIFTLAMSPDGQTLASGGADDTIRLWSLKTGARLATLAEHTMPIHDIAFDALGTRLVSAAGDNLAIIWDLASMEPKHRLQHSDPVLAMTVSHDGSLVITASGSRIFTWDTATAEPVDEIDIGGRAITAIAVSPDDRVVAVARTENPVTLWSLETKEPVLDFGENTATRSLVFSSDGQFLAIGADDGTVRVWSVATGEAVASLDHASSVTDLTFFDQNRRLATVTQRGSLRLWDTRTWEPVQTFTGHGQSINAIVVDVTSGTIATAGVDRFIRLWRTSSMTDLIAARREEMTRIDDHHAGRHDATQQ